jgi:hypothetical protein
MRICSWGPALQPAAAVWPAQQEWSWHRQVRLARAEVPLRVVLRPVDLRPVDLPTPQAAAPRTD